MTPIDLIAVNAALKIEIAVLRDLLETAYRNVDKARAEADKADAEALEHKVRNLGHAAEALSGSYALVKHFQKRAEAAETALGAKPPNEDDFPDAESFGDAARAWYHSTKEPRDDR